MTKQTVRIMIVAGLVFLVLGIVRISYGSVFFGVIGIALGIAILLRAFAARRSGEVV